MVMSAPRSSVNHHITLIMSIFFKQARQGTGTPKPLCFSDHDTIFMGQFQKRITARVGKAGSVGHLPIRAGAGIRTEGAERLCWRGRNPGAGSRPTAAASGRAGRDRLTDCLGRGGMRFCRRWRHYLRRRQDVCPDGGRGRHAGAPFFLVRPQRYAQDDPGDLPGG
jgi:hypothetical protein